MRNEKQVFEVAQPPDDVHRSLAEVRESVEMVRSDIRRTKTDMTRFQDEHQSHVRRTTALCVIVILLIGGLAGMLWYASPMVKQHQGLLSQMPLMRSAFDTVSGRIAATEEKIGSWADDRSGFVDRMSKIENTVGSNLKTVRNEARLWAQQITADVGQKLQALENRITGVESIQREHAQETAQLRQESTRLQGELEGVRKELAGLREENAENAQQIQQVTQAQQSTRNDLTGLDRRLNSNQTAVSALANQIDRQRIDFQVQTGQTEQIAAGIYMTVKQINVERQRVDGWIQIASDGRFVWLRGEGAQKPIEFSSQRDPRPYRLVFTRVEQTGTTGYLLVPVTNTASLPD